MSHRYTERQRPKFAVGDLVKIVSDSEYFVEGDPCVGGVARVSRVFPPDDGGYLYALESTPDDPWHYQMLYETNLASVRGKVEVVDGIFTDKSSSVLAKMREQGQKTGGSGVREYGKCATCSRSFDPEDHFKDARSRAEYRISGCCQICQDEVFENRHVVQGLN